MGAPQPPPKKKSRRWIVFLVVVIILVIGLVWAYSGQGGGLGALGSPTTVSVSGFASTTGVATHPVDVIFTASTGSAYPSPVSLTQSKSGTFSVQLPNNVVYQVTISWTGALGSTGTCNAGTLSVNQGFGSGGLTETYSC